MNVSPDQPRRSRERPAPDINAMGQTADMRNRDIQRCARSGWLSLEYR
jgi:hypothetical protein